MSSLEMIAQVRDALGSVLDPELGIDVVSLGLVYDVRAANGDVQIDLTMTSAACPLADLVVDDARRAAGGVAGVTSVAVTLVYSPPWSPARLSRSAREALGWAPT